MTINVIILAQGSQTRLPNLSFPKQLLQLPDCADAPILERTLRQLEVIAPSAVITLVASQRIIQEAIKFSNKSSLIFCTLADPGNSSLKGLDRYFKGSGDVVTGDPKTHQTVVLLGDVIYSWHCLLSLFDVSGFAPVRFAGTSNLSPGGGELWGVAWRQGIHPSMLDSLERAMAKHPPASVDDTYQPGQMRRLLWDIDAKKRWNLNDGQRPWFVAVDDYTMDIDLPEHVRLIRRGTGVSHAASVDDKEHGLVWEW